MTSSNLTSHAVPELTESVRAGVFPDLRTADRAVESLLAAGFTPEQITVVTSEETTKRHLEEVEMKKPAGSDASESVAVGGAVGAVAVGLTSIALSAATGGVPLLIAGAVGLAGGAAGGFVGAMVSRGNEREVTNFYDQAVRGGQVLVSVEEKGPQASTRLAAAEQILGKSAVQTVALPEG